MGLSEYISKKRVLILKSKTKKGALSEMVRAVAKDIPGITYEKLLQSVWEREALLTTRIAPEIAIPHARIAGLKNTVVAVGKSHAGVIYDRHKSDLVHLFFLIVGGASTHLQALGAVASMLQNPEVCARLMAVKARDDLYALLAAFPAPARKAKIAPVTHAVCHQALQLADQVRAGVVIFHDPPASIRQALAGAAGAGPRLIFAGAGSPSEDSNGVVHLEMPFRSLSRASLVELGLLLALSKGLIGKGEKVVSVFGMSARASLDSVVVTDVAREFKMFFSVTDEHQPGDMEQQVFIRVLQLATELAEEGREGRPMGTLFVVGDYRHVAGHCQQMVINPFKGYDEHERNVLDPGLAETIKEFSHIDGAFIIRGDGLIVSAGTYLRVDYPVANLPSGLGARHAVAASITAVTGAITVAVSESTRKISLFQAGELVMEL